MTPTIPEAVQAMPKAVSDLLKEAYLQGFAMSGEGYNSEYPFNYDEAEILADKNWLSRRDEFLSSLAMQFLQCIKKLKWVEDWAYGLNLWKSSSYAISQSHGGTYFLKGDGINPNNYDNLEAAKAAAQADYEARILSAIEAAPSPRAPALEKLPCDVRLPGVTLQRGVKFSVLLNALKRRESWSDADRSLSFQPVADGWLPIETAPKDGTCVLVWKPDEPRVGEYILVAFWDDAIIKRTPQWVDISGRRLGYLSKADGKPQGYPTHFRPLPASPEGAR